MKKVYQLAAVIGVMLLMPAVVSTTALADFECEIGYTASGSNNVCVSDEVFTCEIDIQNRVVINDSTVQGGVSGDAQVDGNQSGGNAETGSVSNTNGGSYNLTITNRGAAEEECLARKVVPGKPVTPETPEQPEPGRGGVEPQVKPAQQVTPAALPVTSGGKAPVVFITAGAAVTAALALAYRRLFQ